MAYSVRDGFGGVGRGVRPLPFYTPPARVLMPFGGRAYYVDPGFRTFCRPAWHREFWTAYSGWGATNAMAQAEYALWLRLRVGAYYTPRYGVWNPAYTAVLNTPFVRPPYVPTQADEALLGELVSSGMVSPDRGWFGKLTRSHPAKIHDPAEVYGRLNSHEGVVVAGTPVKDGAQLQLVLNAIRQQRAAQAAASQTPIAPPLSATFYPRQVPVEARVGETNVNRTMGLIEDVRHRPEVQASIDKVIQANPDKAKNAAWLNDQIVRIVSDAATQDLRRNLEQYALQPQSAPVPFLTADAGQNREILQQVSGSVGTQARANGVVPENLVPPK